MQVINPLMMVVAVMQILSGVYGYTYLGQTKVALIMLLVGAANAIMATVRA